MKKPGPTPGNEAEDASGHVHGSVTEAALRRALVRVLLLPLLLMLLLTSVLLWQVQHLLDVNRSLDRSNRVIADARRTLRIFVDLEAGYRGYLITGQQDFLQPYLDGRRDLPANIVTLQRDVSDNLVEQRLFDRVLAEYRVWQGFATTGIQLKRAGRNYVQHVLSRSGKNSMNGIRHDMTQIMLIEEGERDAASASARTATSRIVTGGILVSLFLGILLSFTIRGEVLGVSRAYRNALDERERAEADLRTLNATLELRVRARTLDLQQEVQERAKAQARLQEEVDERARAQARLQEQAVALTEQARALLEQARLLDMAHDAIMVRQEDGTITFWSKGAEEMYGWSAEEAIGRTSHVLLRTRFPDSYEQVHAAVFGTGRWEGELVHTRRDGRTLTVASRWALNMDEQGRPAGILEINSDITQRKAAEDLLKDYAARLEQSNRELQDFAIVASHDLQEPLRKIQAFGGLLHDEYAGQFQGDGREYLEEMVGAAGRMQRLIQELLTLSRVTTRGRPFVPTALGEAARAALRDLEARLEETGGRVDIGALPTIDADPVQMHQLFLNLVGNALKFRRPDVSPVVRIEAEITPAAPAPMAPGLSQHGEETGGEETGGKEQDGKEQDGKEQDGAAGGPVCRIAVRDNGIGFDEKYLDRIFAPFQRLHGRGAYEGTGMGLTICRRIVERHGGAITAQSAPGQGTAFIVTLPAQHERGEPS